MPFCCEAPRESYLKSHHSRLHSAKSSWLRLQALAVVRLGTLVITEVGHRIGMFIVISEIPAASPPLTHSTADSRRFQSLCFRGQATVAFSLDRLMLLMQNQSALAVVGMRKKKLQTVGVPQGRVFSLSVFLFGLFLLILQGWHCVTQTPRHRPDCDFLRSAAPQLMSKVPTQTRTETVTRPGLNF